MTKPAHTPYDGSSQPFTIGLKPLDLHDWIEVDDHLPAYLDEKAERNRTMLDRVFAEDTVSRGAQSEVLHLLGEHLPARFPETYRRDGDAIAILPTGRIVTLGSEPPLLAAASLVQEDLVIMQRGESGWYLAAASLCFPSSWSLAEKFGKPLTEIHQPVPGFGPGSRPDELIARMFDRLQPGNPVERFNWSLQPDPDRYKSLSDHARMTPGRLRFPHAERAAGVFIRVERQTLRKLPETGAILFTIRIHIDPLETLTRQPQRAALATSFAGQIAGLDEEELAYKGLVEDRDRLLASLESIAAA